MLESIIWLPTWIFNPPIKDVSVRRLILNSELNLSFSFILIYEISSSDNSFADVIVADLIPFNSDDKALKALIISKI